MHRALAAFIDESAGPIGSSAWMTGYAEVIDGMDYT